MACTVNGIVAGYDGSTASEEALDWAALHHSPCPVAVVHEKQCCQ
jgi:nucleotide-binding universal stress UspA family protein